MSEGIITDPLTVPPGSIPPIGGVNDGLSATMVGTNQFFRLGEPASAPTGAAVLLDDRLIPMSTFFLQLAMQMADAMVNVLMNKTVGLLELQNDFSHSGTPTTEAGFRVSTVPGVPPFDVPYRFTSKLDNLGTVTFLLEDMSPVPTGTTNFKFILKDSGGQGTPLSILNNQFVVVSQQLGVGAGASLNGARLSVLSDGNAANIGLTLKNGDNGTNASMTQLFVNDVSSFAQFLNASTNVTEPSTFGLDNTTLGGDILIKSGAGIFRVKHNVGALVNGGTGSGNALDVNGAVNTSDPGTGVGAVKMGQIKAVASAFDATRYWEINVDGAVIKVALVT